MHVRRRPRILAGSLGVLLLTSIGLAGALPAAAQIEQLPPQEPGVTLRTFQLAQPLEKLCTIRSGSTPNVDKLMPTIDYSSPAEFGAADNFLSHVTANIDVPVDGTYSFRLTSDDGSRLAIDDEVVVDHDGLHGETSKEGSVDLTAGYHPLQIEYFEAGGGEVLRLEWRTPESQEYVLVPPSVLSTEAGVVRVTAPGSKYCEGATDTAGDGLRLDSLNPNYTLTDLRPEGFEPMVAALDWTEDDQLVVVTSGSVSPAGPVDDPAPGEVFLLDNVTGETNRDDVEVTKVATDLLNPMGVAVVDGDIYVSERDGLTRLTADADGDGLLEHERIAEWPYGGNFHEFAFGLLHDEDYFYVSLSVAINQGGATTDPQPAENRGTTIKVDRDTGEVSYVAGGLRTPNGMGWGPEGELFVMDNQGGWLPSSKLVHIKQDRFFNHYTNPAGPFDDQAVTQPVLWLPQNDIGNSPSAPVLLEEGPFAGQMLFGDVTYGGLQRAFLEEVDGEYQGAVFRHSAGLEAGVNRTIVGPDGAIYVGGIGEAGNWSESGKLRYGLQKLTPSGENVFDMKSVSVTEEGFDVEYTQPLSAETAEDLAAAYEVEQWRYIPTPAYGGPKLDEETLEVTGAELSADGTTVSLSIDGLRPGRVVHLRSPRPFTGANGAELWSTEAWYTLNSYPGWDPEEQTSGTFYEAEEGHLQGDLSLANDHAGYTGVGFAAGFRAVGASTSIPVEVAEAGTYDVGLRYTNGATPAAADGDRSVTVYVNGVKVRQTVLPPTQAWNLWATRTETLELRSGSNTIEYRVDPGDTGHVNIDHISVRPSGERIVLLDGADLSEWQHTDGREASWKLVDSGAVEVANGDLRTKQAFGDYRMHVEFKVPELPEDVTGQDRGNSGVYMQERYEIQILDSYGDPTNDVNEAGAIYNQKAPDSNEALPPGEWQTYDIEFRAADFDAAGNKVRDARLTMDWNGVTVHDDVAIPGGTGGNIPEGPSTGAIRLQDHGNAVQFRNIWIEPLESDDPAPPVCEPTTASDEFEGDQLDRCRWRTILRESSSHYRVQDGRLEIDALDGDMHGGATNAANVILQDAPAGGWEAVTKVSVPEGEEYEQGGLIVHANDQNYLKAVLIDIPDVGWRAELGQTVGGSAVFDPAVDRSGELPAGINDDGVWLKTTSDGTSVTAAWSADGEEWHDFGRERRLPASPVLRVGLAAYNGEGQPVAFDFFTLEESENGTPEPPVCEPGEVEEGYRALFDGTRESLDAWNMAGPGSFELTQDCTMRTVGGMGLLWFPEQFGDYSLKLDWKMRGDDNSGVFVGFPDPGNDPWIAVNQGYEIQIDATDAHDRTTGAIYTFQGADAEARDRVLREPGQWNSYEIVVEGQNIKVFLNDTLINDFTSTAPARDLSSGFIGLQNHGAVDDVQFRNVRIADLKDEAPAPTFEAALDQVNQWYEDGRLHVSVHRQVTNHVTKAQELLAEGRTDKAVHKLDLAVRAAERVEDDGARTELVDLLTALRATIQGGES